MARPDVIDTAVASQRLSQLTAAQRMVAWRRGADIPLDDEMTAAWKVAEVSERQRIERERVERLVEGGVTANGAIRQTTTTTWKGMPCRGCGKAIEPTGKRGKPAAWHKECREGKTTDKGAEL